MPVAVVLCLAWSTSALIVSPHHSKMRVTTSSLQSVAKPSRSAALSPASRVPVPRMTFDFASLYSAALSEHYYPTTCLQALALVSFGDVLAQALEQSQTNATNLLLDWGRTLRTGMLGIVIGGLGDAMWLRYLEEPGLFDPILRAFNLMSTDGQVDADLLVVVLKASLDAFIWAPVANALYLVLTPLSEGMSLGSVYESLGNNFLPVMQSELSVALPYNLVAFALIPAFMRPFATGLFSMFFSTYLSYVSHLPSKQQIEMAAMARDAAEVVPAMERIDASRENGTLC